MAATLTKKCRSCDERHELFLPGEDDMDHALNDYEYICPTTRSRVPLRLLDGDLWRTVKVKPRGAVVVSEVARRA